LFGLNFNLILKKINLKPSSQYNYKEYFSIKLYYIILKVRCPNTTPIIRNLSTIQVVVFK